MRILADGIDADGDGGAKSEGGQELIITLWWCNRPCNEAAPPVACPYVCLGLMETLTCELSVATTEAPRVRLRLRYQLRPLLGQ